MAHPRKAERVSGKLYFNSPHKAESFHSQVRFFQFSLPLNLRFCFLMQCDLSPLLRASSKIFPLFVSLVFVFPRFVGGNFLLSLIFLSPLCGWHWVEVSVEGTLCKFIKR